MGWKSRCYPKYTSKKIMMKLRMAKTLDILRGLEHDLEREHFRYVNGNKWKGIKPNHKVAKEVGLALRLVRAQIDRLER